MLGSPNDGSTDLDAAQIKAFVPATSPDIHLNTYTLGVSIGVLGVTGADDLLTNTTITIRVYP